ncbi:acetobutylicum phosphotransbutyrylase [Priestia megaterium]|uniref:VanZ family protein n=1 Tax=Priestia megaterium TaxID=1404 RepID=UPI000BFBF277|nr:VanZ family protein [Priestia megaterium]PGZ80210.1 acetobutylicum phosphotransbutyrylase [Priestia megaterium]
MLKKIAVVLMMLGIAHFSHTPHLEVTHPSSWGNASVWNHNATLWSILKPGSEFYTSYSYGFNLEFILRKIAHISFFGILAVLIYWNLQEKPGRYVKAGLLLACFAFLDEVHQAFIIGRDGRIVDVFIDSFGGALFLFFLYKTKLKKAQANEYISSVKK